MSSRRSAGAGTSQEESVDVQDVMNRMADHAAVRQNAQRQKAFEKARKTAEALDREFKTLVKAQEQELSTMYDDFRAKEADSSEALEQALGQLQGCFASRALSDASSLAQQHESGTGKKLENARQRYREVHEEETNRTRFLRD